MGGSLVPHGGQNPIEAVKLGAAILHGPHVHNFAESMPRSIAPAAPRRSPTAKRCCGRSPRWLTDAPRARRVAEAAKQVVAALGGALERTLGALEPYLMQLRLESGASHA